VRTEGADELGELRQLEEARLVGVVLLEHRGGRGGVAVEAEAREEIVQLAHLLRGRGRDRGRVRVAG